MHRLELPAGSTIRFAAAARANIASHRWDIELFAIGGLADESGPRLTYGSHIGGRDCDQRVDIPAQLGDSWLEVRSRHAAAGAWEDDACFVREDTPALLTLCFSDPASVGAHRDDVVLTFAFGAPARIGQGSQTSLGVAANAPA